MRSGGDGLSCLHTLYYVVGTAKGCVDAKRGARRWGCCILSVKAEDLLFLLIFVSFHDSRGCFFSLFFFKLAFHLSGEGDGGTERLGHTIISWMCVYDRDDEEVHRIGLFHGGR